MSVITEIKYKYLLNKSYLRICTGAKVRIGKNVKICNSRIIVTSGSHMEIGDNVCIENSIISVVNGICTICNNSIIGCTSNRLMFNIEQGEIHIGHHSKISAFRFWVRFGGVISIGDYTNINRRIGQNGC